MTTGSGLAWAGFWLGAGLFWGLFALAVGFEEVGEGIEKAARSILDAALLRRHLETKETTQVDENDI